MRDDRKILPADDSDGKKISSDDSFIGNKKWLIIKLLIVIIPGIIYWVTSDDNFEKKVSFNLSMDAGVSSKKTDSTVQTPTNNIELAQKKYNDGVAAGDRKDYNGAINFYNQAIELNPDYANAYLNRAWCYLKLKNFNQAVPDCDIVIRLEPKNADSYTFRCIAYAALGDLNNSFNDSNTAIQLGKENMSQELNLAIAHHIRGVGYQIKGENEKAQADFAISKKMGYLPQ